MNRFQFIFFILITPFILFGQFTETQFLSVPRGNIKTAVFGENILFVGGSFSGVVDYFDATNHEMTSGIYGSDGFSNAKVVQSDRYAVFFKLVGVNLLSVNMYVFDNVSKQWHSDKFPGNINIGIESAYIYNNMAIFFDTNDKEYVHTYNLETREWNKIPTPFTRREMTIIDTGEKIFFIGGRETFSLRSDSVHVYNKGNSTWDGFTLAEAKNGVTAIQYKDKIVIAGGQLSNLNADRSVDLVEIIDIEDYSSVTLKLSEKKNNLKGVVVKNKVIFAGGNSQNAEVINMDDYSLTTYNFNVSRNLINLNGGSVGSKAVFAGGNDEDGNLVFVYDNDMEEWSNFMIEEARSNMAFVSVENKLFAAGGELVSGGVRFNEIYILEDISTSNFDIEKEVDRIETFPNPVSNILYINEISSQILQASILDINGRILKKIFAPTSGIDVSFLNAGTYIITIHTENSVSTKKFIKN